MSFSSLPVPSRSAELIYLMCDRYGGGRIWKRPRRRWCRHEFAWSIHILLEKVSGCQHPSEPIKVWPEHHVPTIDCLIETFIKLHLDQTQEGGGEGWLELALSPKMGADASRLLHQGDHLQFHGVHRHLTKEYRTEDSP